MNDSKKFYLFVGYPRTATTFLQQVVIPNQTQHVYWCPGHRPDAIAELVNYISFTDEVRYDPEHAELLLKTGLEDVADGTRSIIFADEKFLILEARDHGVICQRLAALFAPCKILINIRSQYSLVESHYTQFPITRGSLNEFLREQAAARFGSVFTLLDYNSTVKFYEKFFGEQNININVYEFMKNDLEIYKKRISDFLDLPDDFEFKFDHQKRVHDRKTYGALAYQKLTNFYEDTVRPAMPWLRPGRFIPGWDHAVVQRGVSRMLSRKVEAKIGTAWTHTFESAFGASNRLLGEKYDLDLARFGYPIGTLRNLGVE
jgi:hypothetical protein